MLLEFQGSLPTADKGELQSAMSFTLTPAELEAVGGDEFLQIVINAPKDPVAYLRALSVVASMIKEVLPFTGGTSNDQGEPTA